MASDSDSDSDTEVILPKCDPNHKAIKDWTKHEKWLMLECFEFPSKNKKFSNIEPLDLMYRIITTKTPKQIREACAYYKSIALQYPKEALVNKAEQNQKTQQKILTKWEEKIKNQNPAQTKVTETSTALRMIADLEKIPPPEQTENIDFRQVYHQLANALEGKPIVGDQGVLAVLHMAYKDTAARAKRNLNPQMRDFLRKLNTGESFVQEKFPGRPTEDPELRTLRHLGDQDIYNPLKVPEERLKMPGANPRFTAKKRNLKNPVMKVAKK